MSVLKTRNGSFRLLLYFPNALSQFSKNFFGGVDLAPFGLFNGAPHLLADVREFFFVASSPGLSKPYSAPDMASCSESSCSSAAPIVLSLSVMSIRQGYAEWQDKGNRQAPYKGARHGYHGNQIVQGGHYHHAKH